MPTEAVLEAARSRHTVLNQRFPTDPVIRLVTTRGFLGKSVDQAGEGASRVPGSAALGQFAGAAQAGPQGSVPISAGTETSTSSRSSDVAVS